MTTPTTTEITKASAAIEKVMELFGPPAKKRSRPDKTVEDVARKALPRRQKGTWSHKEVVLLERNYNKMPIKELQRRFFPGRTHRQLYSKAWRLDLQREHDFNFWSDEEIAILKKNALKYTNKELQAKFFPGRSIRSVEGKIAILGGKGGPFFQEDSGTVEAVAGAKRKREEGAE